MIQISKKSKKKKITLINAFNREKTVKQSNKHKLIFQPSFFPRPSIPIEIYVCLILSIYVLQFMHVCPGKRGLKFLISFVFFLDFLVFLFYCCCCCFAAEASLTLAYYLLKSVLKIGCWCYKAFIKE